MDKRKAIINEYKKRRLAGGVYKVTNTTDSRYLLAYAVDLKSAQNRFQFSQTVGMVFDTRLQKAWDEVGPQAFRFEIIEELEQGPDQSREAFIEDLKVLEQLQRANLDAAAEYR